MHHSQSPQDPSAITVPWQEMRNQACGAWHVTALAAYPEHRLGSALLDIAERLRQASGANGISLLVADSNAGARRLYERCGFSRRPAGPWQRGIGRIPVTSGCCSSDVPDAPLATRLLV
jgi:ribosomal protein S18 acetylase RimI-like enzyme